MPRFSGKQADIGVPVTIDKERYTEGDVATSFEGGVVLGEKPGNVAYPIQIDASGYLKVAIGGGVTPGTEYSDGDSNAGSKGTLIMGDDGTLLQNIAVDANGRLQIEVVEGEYDGIQYQDGAAVASPFGTVALGHNGSNVFPVVVDSNGYLQIEVLELPSDTFVAENGALGKGVLLQGDDGTDRHNVAVDTAGHLQVDEVKASTLNSVADVTLAATATTQIVGGLTTRLCVFISNKKINTQTMRIGDSNAGATRGIELAPGESISLETTEAIHGYNPGSSGEAVSVIWTED